MRPSEPHEVIQQSVRQVPLLAILEHADRAMTLRQLRAVGTRDHRNVRVLRRGQFQRTKDINVSRRVVQMIVAADDVRDAHVAVVDDNTEMVGRRAVGAQDHEIV